MVGRFPQKWENIMHGQHWWWIIKRDIYVLAASNSSAFVIYAIKSEWENQFYITDCVTYIRN